MPTKTEADTASTARRRSRSETRRRLVEAAREEFREVGYLGTNTNRIARRARVSPQTYYRHFDDKVSVFRAVYAEWITESWKRIADAVAAGGSVREVSRRIVDTVVAHYASSSHIRADVRMLAAREPSFRDLYLSEGRRQLEITRANRAERGQPPLQTEEYLACLVVVERMADALAFDEVSALGGDPERFRELLADFIARYISARTLWNAPEEDAD